MPEIQLSKISQQKKQKHKFPVTSKQRRPESGKMALVKLTGHAVWEDVLRTGETQAQKAEFPKDTFASLIVLAATAKT